MILVVDNYDSFTFNLVQALGALGQEIVVRRNDQIDVGSLSTTPPAGVVLSPGPGRPENAGCCVELVRVWGDRVPILGVCLGHQAIGLAFGGTVAGAGQIVHGKTAAIEHDGTGLFTGLPNPFEAARYHSLALRVDTVPDELEVNARTGEVVMGVRHRERPIHGVQFHPESIATPQGTALLANFVRLVTRVSEVES